MSGPLGVIAGGGELPRRVADHALSTGRDVFIISLRGFVTPGLLDAYSGAEAAMGEIGKAIRLFREAGCRELVFAGTVSKPDISALRFDMHGMSLVPQLMAAAGKGDDALLRVVVGAFEKAGFDIVGADDILTWLVAPAGPIGGRSPTPAEWADLRLAAAAALELGANDLGQGAVARLGAVIAREAQDGTDAMLSRISRVDPPSGVLVKRPKPQQERRIDLPTIGAATVEGAARAGLTGIAVEAQSALVMDREKLVALADAAGLFVYGFTKAELA